MNERPRWVIPAFALYAAALFTGTHWPNLRVEGPVPRTDLWVHVGAFGGWMILACLCGWFGRPASAGNVLRTGLIAVLYAGIDEGLQAIPFIHRTAAWDDFGVDALGVVLAGTAVWIVGRRRRDSAP